MQLAFSDGSHIVDNPAQYFAAHRRLGVRGLGDAGSIAAISAQGAATTGGLLAGLAAMGTLAPEFALAGPIGAAVAGLVAIGLAIANQFQGCGQTCIAATSIANQVGVILTNNFNTYMDAPVHYASMQKAALNNFDIAWAAMVKACSDPALQAAGQRCISDRQAGSCAYQDPAGAWVQASDGSWSFQGSAGPNCWNWFTGLRDPIANDPTVVHDPVGAITDPTTGAVTGIQPPSIFGGTVASLGPVLLIGGGIAAALLLLGSD